MTIESVEPASSPEERGLVRLYIAGQSPRSLDAFANLREICERYLPGLYEIEVVDLVEYPELAMTDNVLALPTLVRLRPPPPRRIIGDLSDTERVLGYLSIPKAVTP